MLSNKTVVPCGLCVECRNKLRNEWTARLHIEHKHARYSEFTTLTYSDENLVYDSENPTLYKPDLQNFMKRLRRRNEGNKIRFYGIGEYGDKFGRPHYHLLLFSNFPIKHVEKAWGKGNVHRDDVTPASIHYCTGYIRKQLHHELVEKAKARANGETWEPVRQSPFSLMSTRPSIGYQYITYKNYRYHITNMKNTMFINGRDVPLPRYYRERFFAKPSRELLAKTAADIALETDYKTRDKEKLGKIKKEKQFKNKRKDV
jgi:hypothetical protein